MRHILEYLPTVMAGFLASSYAQYENDTSAFTTWLGKAAEACGYKPKRDAKLSESMPDVDSARISAASRAPRPRLRGKARKQVDETDPMSQPGADDFASVNVKKYAVTTQNLLDQIDLVSQSGRSTASMPPSIRTVLERAMKARERCATWFERVGNIDDGGHRHFIDVLRTAMSKLSPVATRSEPGPG